MTRYRLAIFDFDGTLADTLPWFRASFHDVIARFDLKPVTAEELEDLRGLSAREIMARLGVSTWQLPAIVNDMRKRKLAAAGETSLFSGIPETLAELQRIGIQIAIVSSDSEASVRQVLGPVTTLVTRFDCGAAIFGKHWKSGASPGNLGSSHRRQSASAMKSAISRPRKPPRWIRARWPGAMPSLLRCKPRDRRICSTRLKR